MTTTIPEAETVTEILPFESVDDPAHRSHYVRPADNGHRGKSPEEGGEDATTAQDIVDMARLAGREVVALCGFRWIPKANPKRHPVCPACVEIAARIVEGTWY